VVVAVVAVRIDGHGDNNDRTSRSWHNHRIRRVVARSFAMVVVVVSMMSGRERTERTNFNVHVLHSFN
jgi:hypothetical protein